MDDTAAALAGAIISSVRRLLIADQVGARPEKVELDLATAIRQALPPADPMDDDAVRRAALALLARLDHITTDQFANGAEYAEREALRDALGYGA